MAAIPLMLCGCLPQCDTGLYQCSVDNWCQLKTTLPRQTLRRIWGLSGHDLWAVGDHGTVLHWDGAAWKDLRVDRYTTEDLSGVWASSSTDIWIVGKNSTLLRGDGTSWRSVVKPTNQDLYDIWGGSSDDVWIVGAMGTVLHFDGAPSIQSVPTTNILWAVWGRAGQEVVTVGGQETICVYSYKERRWSLVHTDPLGGALLGVYGTGSETYAVGENGTYLLSDGMARARGGVLQFHAVWASSPTNVWILGSTGAVLQDVGGPAPLPRVSGVGGTLFSVFGFGSEEIWAVGSDGIIMNYQP